MRRWRYGLLTLALLISPLTLLGQSVTVRVVGDQLHVRGAALRLIEGSIADRLKDGTSMKVDFELTVLEKPGGLTIAQGRQTFTVSFDLWEQRFAVTRTGAMPRSMSHLAARDAEAWCLDNVTVPVASLGHLGRDVPFWVRIEYRVQDPIPAPDAGDDSTFTLRKLIDVLSRRREDQAWARSMEAGPFRLSK
jgi:hypothetical protein